MGFLDLLLKKKKKGKKKEKKEAKVQTIVTEEPIVTLTREILGVRYSIDDLKRAMHDDHHRILDEFDYLPKKDDFKDVLGEKIERLKKEKEKIEEEIELSELQKDILEHLKEPKSAAEVASEIGKSRTWVSQQIAKMTDSGIVESKKEGKNIRYFTSEITSDTEKPET